MAALRSKRMVLAGAAVAVFVVAAGAGQGTVGKASASTLFVAPGGSDAGRCTRAAPCKSFARAYSVARPGDTVLVGAGQYGEQTIPVDRDKGAGTGVVVFRPASSGSVVIDGDLHVYGSRVEFRELKAELWYAHPGSSQLSFRNLDVERFYITSASNIRVLGGDVGPSVDRVSQIKAATDSTTPPRNILLSGLKVHDFTRSNKSHHMECLHVMAVDGLTIRNSRFERCSIFDISFNEHGDSDAMRGILVENNFFDRTLDGGHYAVHFSSGDPCEAMIRFNTFLQGVSAECPETRAGVRFESNILPSMNSTLCGRNGYSFDWNVYESGQRCGPNDRVGNAAFVGRDKLDVRLSRSSAAIGRGNPDSAPTHDISGKRRPLRWRPDAGAHQREPVAIVPGRSIGAVRLGASRSTVEAEYRAAGGRGRGARVHYAAPGGRLWVHYRHDQVIGIGTSSTYYSTTNGVGPGATLAPGSALTRLPWNECRKAYVRVVGSGSVYYAPAGGSRSGVLGSIAMFQRGVDDCGR